MEDHGNKPTMCSVLFMDIVEYSRKPVSAQIALKEGFNAILSSAIRDVPIGNRIILDTGDGAAICFLGETDDALKVALLLRQGLLSVGAHIDPPLQVRLGINHGPVRLVSNANEQPNVVGDGINVAHRIMGFAKPGQMLASRSYYDAVSRQTQKYAGMFRHEGSRTDRHVREHELFAIAPPGESTIAQPAPVKGAAGEVAVAHHMPWELRALYIGVAAALLIFALFKLWNRPAEYGAPVQSPPVAEAPEQLAASQTAAAESVALPGKMGQITERKPELPHSVPGGAVQPAPATTEHAPAVQKKAQAVPDASKEAGLQSPTSRAAREIPPAGQGDSARVGVAVTPWGEIYLDGKMRGVSPPLVELQVAAGKHEIEIRNTTFPAYKQSIQIKAGEKIKIRHKFAN